MVEADISNQVKTLLLTLWEAEGKPSVRAWAIHVALTFAINKYPGVNKRDIWKLIQDEYTTHLQVTFPDQREPGQSYRRASGDAWEMFVEEYLNSNEQFRRSIRVGDKASDPEPEQGYLTLQAVETDGVLKGVVLFLCKARRVEAVGAGVLVAKGRATPTPQGLLGAFL